MNEILTVYGITNCDKVRTVRKWLDAEGHGFAFVDFKQIPPSADLIQIWLNKLDDPAKLVNKRSTTWRQLDDNQRDGITDPSTLIALLSANPTLIPRPVIEWQDQLWLGIKPADLAKHLSEGL